MEEGYLLGTLVRLMRENTKIINVRDLDSIQIVTGKFILENGKMEEDMVLDTSFSKIKKF